MSREKKEHEIYAIAKGLKGADATIFAHALSTYRDPSKRQSMGAVVTAMSPDEFETFYGDVMYNWGPQAPEKGPT